MAFVFASFSDRRWLLAGGLFILIAAGWIRWAQVAERVPHVDEAVQAYQTWRLMEEGVYDYSPQDRHGPVLYLLSAASMKVTGILPEALTIEDLRLFSAFWGCALILMFLVFGIVRREFSWVAGAAILALEPFAVCYQNDYIQEPLLAFLSFALLGLVVRSQTALSAPLAVGIGALGALLLATKETGVLHGGVLLVAWIVVGGRKHWRGAWTGRYAAYAIVAAVGVWVLAMSQGFRRWDAVAEGLGSYFHYLDRAGDPAHSKPFFYYISLFWPQRIGGVWWSQMSILVGALGGTFVLFAGNRRGLRSDLLPFVAVFSWGLLLLYSVIPYKMPWLLLTPLSGLCLLAGVGVAALFDLKRRWVGFAAGLASGLVIGVEGVRMWKPALFRYADDDRNPYLYAHTSPGFARLEERLRELLLLEPEAPVAVVGADSAWPLPWTLRRHASVGYFDSIPENLERYEIVVLDASLAPTDELPFLPGFVPEAHGLRANVLLLLYIREPLWSRFLQTR